MCRFSECHLNAAKKPAVYLSMLRVLCLHVMFEEVTHNAQEAAWSLTGKQEFAVKKFVFQGER